MRSLAIKRVYEPPSPKDGTRILVDRLWPRGLRKDAAQLDEWAKDVAPSTELRTWYGAPSYFLLGAMHAVLFWISISMLSPFILLIGLFNTRRRLLHDIVLGTVVVNTSVRAQVGQPARTY